MHGLLMPIWAWSGQLNLFIIIIIIIIIISKLPYDGFGGFQLTQLVISLMVK